MIDDVGHHCLKGFPNRDRQGREGTCECTVLLSLKVFKSKSSFVFAYFTKRLICSFRFLQIWMLSLCLSRIYFTHLFFLRLIIGTLVVKTFVRVARCWIIKL